MRALRALLALALVVGFAALAQSGSQSAQQSGAKGQPELGTGGAGDAGTAHGKGGKHKVDAGM